MTRDDDTDSDAAHKGRITDVMSRTGIDLHSVYTPQCGKAWIEAAQACKRCEATGDCTEWIARTEDGSGADAPAFCPNAALFRQFKPKTAQA